MKVLDLFSGIGGFSLGLERTGGFETVAFCEIDPYCQKVLKKHWPEVPIYDDVRKVTAARLVRDGIGVDVITGGFPCQDISVAGKQAGITGERSGLWSEFARIISEVRPRYAILENVTALTSGDRGRWFGRVLGDLAEIRFDAEWHCIPASALGAHHHRDRVWIIAYPSQLQRDGGEYHGENSEREVSQFRDSCGERILADSTSKRSQVCLQAQRQEWATGRAGYGSSDVAYTNSNSGERLKPSILNAERWQIERERQARSCSDGSEWWGFESRVGRIADGIPHRAHRLKGLGNAVVPQIPELIGHAIISHAKSRQRRHPAD